MTTVPRGDDYCTMWSDHCTMWSDHCTMWDNYCTMWDNYCTMWDDHCTWILSQMLAGHSKSVNKYHVRGWSGNLQSVKSMLCK